MRMAMMGSLSFNDPKNSSGFIYFNCDSNWYPVSPLFFPVAKLARRWNVFYLWRWLSCTGWGWWWLASPACKLRVLSRRFLACIFFQQLYKLLFWKLHKKLVLLVEKKNFFLLLFFRSYLKLVLLIWLN